MYGDTDFSPPTRRIGDTVAGGLLAWQARSRTRELLTAGRVSALLGDHGRGVHGGGGGGLAVAALNATVPVVSFEELVMGGWSLALDVRARPARQLCVAIDILEQTGGMAHVDLSAANVMILFLDGAVPRLFLIDFDGFRRLRVPPVPISKDLPSGRSWGTPGCHSATFRKGTDTLVNTDGVAVVLRAEDADPLPRDTVLCQREIDAPQVPDEIAARWPEGWSLVQEAVAAAPGTQPAGVASRAGAAQAAIARPRRTAPFFAFVGSGSIRSWPGSATRPMATRSTSSGPSPLAGDHAGRLTGATSIWVRLLWSGGSWLILPGEVGACASPAASDPGPGRPRSETHDCAGAPRVRGTPSKRPSPRCDAAHGASG